MLRSGIRHDQSGQSRNWTDRFWLPASTTLSLMLDVAVCRVECLMRSLGIGGLD